MYKFVDVFVGLVNAYFTMISKYLYFSFGHLEIYSNFEIKIRKNNCFILDENKYGLSFIFKGFSLLKYESLYNGLVEIF